jgi:hypothetical protein
MPNPNKRRKIIEPNANTFNKMSTHFSKPPSLIAPKMTPNNGSKITETKKNLPIEGESIPFDNKQNKMAKTPKHTIDHIVKFLTAPSLPYVATLL